MMILNKDLAGKIVELLKSAHDEAKYALDAFKTGDLKTFAQILTDAQNAVLSVNENLLPYSEALSMSQCFNIITNIQNSIINMVDRISVADLRRAEIILEFEIIPLLAELKEDIYFFCLIYPDKDRMDKYYKDEFAKNHQNEYVRDGKTRFDVSLVVVAWNKLDYTKLCVESLFKYTDIKGLNCELITINHGSSDGTEEFFESLPHEKKINFKANMCMIAGLYLFRVVEGKYCVTISNDVVLTQNWLENMLGCIKSDSKIVFSCPVTSNVSNNQAIPVSYISLDQMQEFAAAYNISNSDMWDERIKICPPLGIFNMNILNMIGCNDRYFFHMEFGDDNMSTVFRRNGYKQILQRDTFCHHFGSITLGEAQRMNNTLEKSRRLFFIKNGLDPWGLGFCYDSNIITSLDYDIDGHVKILGIDTGFGSTPLQIKNELRHKGNRNALLYNFTEDVQFEPELKPYSDHFSLAPIENIESVYEKLQFDYIYIGKKLEEYPRFENFLLILKKILKTNGQLIFQINNPYNVISLHELSHFKTLGYVNRQMRIDPFWLMSYLRSIFSKCEIITITTEIPNQIYDFYNHLLRENANVENAEMILKTAVFQFKLRG